MSYALNLVELYSATKGMALNPPPFNKRVTTNLWGTRIYDVRFGWGRAWRWIYSLLSPIFGNRLPLNTLKSALIKTHQAYLNFFHQQFTHLEEYKNSQDSESLHALKLKNNLNVFFRSTFPFIKRIHATKEHGLREFLDHALLTTTQPFQLDVWADPQEGILGKAPYSLESFRAMEPFYYLFSIEGQTLYAFPKETIKKIYENTPLDLDDKQELVIWTERLKKISYKSHHFFLALQAIFIRFYPNLNPKKAAAAAVLSTLSQQYGLKTAPIDLSHIHWQKHLTPHSTVSGIELIKELPHSPSGSKDRFHVWSIKNRDDVVFMTGANRTDLWLKQELNKKASQIIPLYTFENISQEGRWATIEKLKNRADQFQWPLVSQWDPFLSQPETYFLQEPEQLKNAKGIVDLLKLLLEKKIMLDPFDPSVLYYFNQWKTTALLKESPLTFPDLLKIAKVLSKGNVAVLKYIFLSLPGFQIYKNQYDEIIKAFLADEITEDRLTEISENCLKQKLSVDALQSSISHAIEFLDELKRMKSSVLLLIGKSLNMMKVFREQVPVVYSLWGVPGMFPVELHEKVALAVNYKFAEHYGLPLDMPSLT